VFTVSICELTARATAGSLFVHTVESLPICHREGRINIEGGLKVLATSLFDN
jgi:hypothetical protein